jgi:hypothetical protein
LEISPGRLPSVPFKGCLGYLSAKSRSRILLNGLYTFRDGGLLIDLDAIVAALDLE